jgi:hypothetical protein
MIACFMLGVIMAGLIGFLSFVFCKRLNKTRYYLDDNKKKKKIKGDWL